MKMNTYPGTCLGIIEARQKWQAGACDLQKEDIVPMVNQHVPQVLWPACSSLLLFTYYSH